MREYIFKKVDTVPDINSPVWERVETAYIDNFDFSPEANNPNTTVKGVYSDNGITLLYESDEKNVLARSHGVNEKPWLDSCVEFFFNPCPEKEAEYFNFELSAGGGLLIGFGKERHNRKRCEFTLDTFNITTEITAEGWRACFTVPFSFVLWYASDFSTVFSGNFQKCGDETESPHFPVWNKIESESPDFHRPESFGRLVLGGY